MSYEEELSFVKTKWWEAVLLWFRPKIITADGTYRLVGKELFGRIFIVDEYDIALQGDKE